jgi:hypothetical protein
MMIAVAANEAAIVANAAGNPAALMSGMRECLLTWRCAGAGHPGHSARTAGAGATARCGPV